MPSIPAPPTEKICTTPECGKKVCARGFCVACYYRKLRRGELEAGTETKRWKHRISNVDETTRMGDCTHCGRVKVIKRSENRWRCYTDVKSRSKDYKEAYRQSKKEQLLDHCEICGTKENLCWDHSHITGKFRGTLCSKCNTAIGMFSDDPQRCMEAALYLRRDNEHAQSGSL